MDPIIVLKFGHSILNDDGDLPVAVHEIYRCLREGQRVVAVVSALGKTTDRLLAQAQRLVDRPEPEGLAALLATGEATATSLLALALDKAGIPAVLLDPCRVGLRTEGPLLDAEARELNRRELFHALEQRPVAVLSGFVGQDFEGRTSLLGRGGSDMTALFVAHQLGARTCRLVKDVDGLYDHDPATSAAVRRYATITWEDALRLGGRALQAKAIHYAQRFGISFEVAAPGSSFSTVIGRGPSRLVDAPEKLPPLRVTLLGLGTVGLGVYRHLAAWQDRFEVVGIAVRNIGKHRRDVAQPELLSTDPWEVLERPSDLVIEAIGGERPASDLVAAALERGRDVVTANKAVVAAHGRRLLQIAAERDARLSFSATVGGGVPVVESVERVARRGPIRSVEGVLNATTTFVLDQIVKGCDLAGAVRAAQENGFAEADPTFDLDGTDAAHKLVIVARSAFGVDLAMSDVRRRGIDHLDPEEVRAAHAAGSVVRLVASCQRTAEGILAEVSPVSLPGNHPLAQPHNEENRVLIQPVAGAPVVADGKGAGRWPTSESVLADILDIYRLRRAQTVREQEEMVAAPDWDEGVPLGTGWAAEGSMRRVI